MDLLLYLLDTNICIYLLNGELPEVASRLADIPLQRLAISTISVAELRYGALHSARAEQNLTRVETFVTPLNKIPFDEQAAVRFGEVKQALVAKGKIIGLMDLLIASCALAVDGTVVTNNMREFARIPGLKAENWVREDSPASG